MRIKMDQDYQVVEGSGLDSGRIGYPIKGRYPSESTTRLNLAGIRTLTISVRSFCESLRLSRCLRCSRAGLCRWNRQFRFKERSKSWILNVVAKHTQWDRWVCSVVSLPGLWHGVLRAGQPGYFWR